MVKGDDGKGPKDAKKRVKGVSLWSDADSEGELNTHDDLTVEPENIEWLIHATAGPKKRASIRSTSPAVRRFMRQVLTEKERVSRSASPPRPVPKPAASKPHQFPPYAMLACPVCRPGATPEQPGEAWSDCPLCDGEGTVSARQAQEWDDREH